MGMSLDVSTREEQVNDHEKEVALEDIGSNSPLVGREQDLTRLLRLLTRQPSRAGVLLTGASGVGKTRLTEEAVRQLREAGHQVIRIVTAWPEYSTPHLSWTQSISGKDQDVAPAASLGDAVTLINKAGPRSRQNIVFYIDDSHLMTNSMASMVREVAKQRCVRLLLAANTEGTFPPAITDLWKDEHLHRIHIDPLKPADARRLASALTGNRIATRTAIHLAQLADGSPLLMRELVRAAHERFLFRSSASGWTLPDEAPLSTRLVELISQKFAELDDTSREALERIALAEPVPLELVHRLSHESALLRLEDAQLVRVDSTLDGTGRTVQFVRIAHPLTSYVIRTELPPLRRRYHLESWLSVYPDLKSCSDSEIITVTSWRLEIGLPVSEGQLLNAALIARDSQQLHLALRFSAAAWRDHPSARTATEYVLSLISVADFAAAELILEEAKQAFPEQIHELMPPWVRTHLLQGEFTQAKEKVALLEGAQRQLYDGMCAYFEGRIKEALSFCEPLTEDPGTPGYAEAAIIQIASLLHAGRPQDALCLYKRFTQVGLNDAFHSDSLVQLHASALADLGRVEEAVAVLRTAHQTSVSERLIRIEPQRGLDLGAFLLEQGLVRQALDLLTFDPSYRVGWPLWDEKAAALRIMAEAATGKVSDTPLPAERLRHFSVSYRVAQAWRAFLDGHRDLVASSLTSAAKSAIDTGANAHAAIAVHEMGRLGLASLAAEFWSIPVQGDLLQAKLDYSRSLHTGDNRLLRKSAEYFAENGFFLFAAEAYAELASLYLRYGQERAATAASLRARELVQKCEGATTPALWSLGSAKPVTARERELMALVSQGLTDKQIAERLTVSVRTVNNHLYRIYRKLGIANRRDLRAALSANRNFTS